MTESIDLYREIQALLPETDTVQVMAALRQDPLVWHSLQQPQILKTALQEAGNQPGCWNPGQLALMSLTDTRADALREEPLAPLDHALQEKALRAYQAIQRTSLPPAALAEAGLLALALRERRRLTGTWSGLLQELMPKTGPAEAAFPLWRTALACLYAYVPDPVEMLRGLLPKTNQRTPFDWIVFTQMAQPLSQAEHVNIFTQVLKGLSVPFQLSALRSLSLHGNEAVAGLAADRLLIGHPSFTSLRIHHPANELDLAGLSGRALSLQQLGTFYQLAGDHSQALSLFDNAEAAIQQWLARIYLQRMNSRADKACGENGVLMDCQQLSHLASAAGWLKEDLGAVMISHPYASSILDQVNEDVESAFLSIKRASMMAEEQPTLARDLARQSAQVLLEQVKTRGMPFEGENVFLWRPQDAIQILLTLGLAEEALALGLAIIETRPADVGLLHLTAGILAQVGRTEQALGYEFGAVALDPQNPTWRRSLADLYGRLGNWAQAYDEWKLVLSLSNPPQMADRQACSLSALEAGYLDEARMLSEGILEEDANNGTAMGILGQVFIRLGQKDEAVSKLVKATMLCPDNLSFWLALAQVQKDLDEPQRALETLRAATAALPEAPAAHLALGKACDDAGLMSEGLASFKKAYLLSPEDHPMLLAYGNALRRLGYSSEARAIFESVRPAIQTNPALAYEYAQVLLDLNDPEAAIPVLDMALKNGLPVLEGHLLYAKVLLGQVKAGEEVVLKADPSASAATIQRIHQAEQVLQKVMVMDPGNLEARFLRADILREKGMLEEALSAYRHLADLLDTDHSELGWRVQWGIARTAMCLKRVDTSLAAYKEACQMKPDSLALRRGLAEASLQASLPHEAVEAADQVLQMASDDVDNLAWYAEFTARMGENEKAVFALERAVQIDPQRPDLLVDLAQWQMSAGDLSAARATLETVTGMQRFHGGGRENYLRRAAQMYLRLQDPQAALECYERALAIEPAPDYNLYLEVAELQERMDNLEAALDLAQKAQEVNPESLPVFLLQSDLLSRLNRPQAAMALLERALRLIQGNEAQQENLTPYQKDQLGEIHERFMHLMIQEENLHAALYHAEQALSLQPGSAGLAYRAADLASSMIQVDRAGRILASVQVDGEDLAQAMLEQGTEGLHLLCMHIETALAEEQNQAAQELLERALYLTPNVPRLQAARIRVDARQGNTAEAAKLYAALVALMKHDYLPELENQPIWLVEAALEARIWKDALAFAGNYCAAHPMEARGYLLYAKALVRVAEHQRLCTDLGCTISAPGGEVLGEEYQLRFTEAIQAASKLANVGEIGRWQARGQAAYAPSAQSVRVLAALPAAPEDVAALIAVLRQLNNRTAAMQVARRFPEDGNVLLQLALCYENEDSLEGLGIAEQAVQSLSNDCLAHAAMARLAMRASAYNRAIEAYGKALEINPGEPEWHDAAGDLFLQAGKVQQALWHRQQALDLVPNRASYAYKLGQACLALSDTAHAVEYLERATVLDGQQAQSWLALASAYHMADRLPQAMEAAKQAGTLNPASAEGLLVAGEIALSMNQTAQALDMARDAVRREPENASALLFLSSVMTMQGKEEESLALLESASAQAKAVYPVAIERARLIYKVHGPQAALEVLEKLVKDYPEEPGLISLIAQTEAECGDSKSAERYAFKALKLNPNQPDLTLMLGRLQRKSGQLDQAVQLLSDAIRMSPNSLEAFLELAGVHQDRREFVQALQVYRQGMRVAPHDFQAYYQSGLIMRDSKDYIGAEAMLRKAAELAPDNLSIRRQLVGVIALNLVHNKQEVPLS